MASVEIMVVICPTLCFIRPRPLRRSDFLNMAPINCGASQYAKVSHRKKRHTLVRMQRPFVIATESLI